MSLIQQCEQSLALVKELHRKPNSLPPYNEEAVRTVMTQIEDGFTKNHEEIAVMLDQSASSSLGTAPKLTLGIQARHAAIERHRRCTLAYAHERVRRVCAQRWVHGAVLPPSIRANLSCSEKTLFSSYNNALANYMKSLRDGQSSSIGDFLSDFDVTLAAQPPKGLFVKVRSLGDFGHMAASDGGALVLRRNSIHLLARHDAEPLIRQGVLEHVGNQ